jgi:hypothetical protein
VPKWGWLAGCGIAFFCFEVNKRGDDTISLIATALLARLIVARQIEADERTKWMYAAMYAVVGALVYTVISGRWGQ